MANYKTKAGTRKNKARASSEGKTNTNTNKAGMSREEAGRKGGEAPHSCRGRECDKKSSSRSRSSW